MKKLFFLTVAFFVMSAAVAFGQTITLPEGVTFTGVQYHQNSFSLFETTRKNQYLLVSNFYTNTIIHLPPKEICKKNRPFGADVKIYDIQPTYDGSFAEWHVSTSNGFYVVSTAIRGRASWSTCHEGILNSRRDLEFNVKGANSLDVKNIIK